MRNGLFVLALLVSALSLAAAQQSVKLEVAEPETVRVFKAGNGVTAPELLPTSFATADCATPLSGEIELATIIDVSGAPRNIMFVHPLGNDLDSLALSTLAAAPFQPGESNGSPVPVAESVSIKLDACPVQVQSGSPGATFLRVRSQPQLHLSPTEIYPGEVIYTNATLDLNGGIFRPGPDVTPPVMLPAAPIVEIGSGNTAKYSGEVMVTLIVDAFGMPMNVRVARPLGKGLDQKAIDAVRNARFKPAIFKGKQPVPVMITIAVQCRIY
ncbi:energy transducer TonB [Occallatibacter riparius]|uniref:Energy transducer TonB n=1 Tax=Occallatibacter riparius TaxID=1002689 RepID=A0A9J7BI61_9BACT|nr:energy transducer TonB [Occallatibacter riparius]UWZ82628.1 energy transducer TonB [Occallatibacter riparius]